MEVKSLQTNTEVKTYTTDGSNAAAEKLNKTDEKKDKKSKENINAGELNLPGPKESKLKQLLAKKNALKVQLDQFDKDIDMDDKIKGHAENRDAYLKEADTNQKEVNRLNGLKEELKETYAVEDDSREQKDLELLEKRDLGKETLTKEEEDRLANMGPLTDYQKQALDYDKAVAEFQKRADNARNDSINENSTITAIKLELLKDSPMVEAKKAAEEILKDVDDDIQKAMIEEIKKKVNENLDIDPNQQLDPKTLVDQKKVTEEDLKGLAVDEKV
jgi:hypothetical protein